MHPEMGKGSTPEWNRATVLIVEDDGSVLQVIRLMLGMEGYSVLAAESEDEALELAQGKAGRIDLLLADVKLKQGSGPGTARRLRLAHPGLKVVFMSGYLREDLIESGLIRNQDVFLPKPFDVRAFRSIIRDQYPQESSWTRVL